MSSIMEYRTISETDEKPLLRRMRGATSFGRIVRTRSKGNNKSTSSKSGWKSLLSPVSSSKRRTKKDALDILDQVINGGLINDVPLATVERKVRFDLSSNQVVEADPEGLSEQEIKYCWWNSLERYQCTESYRQELRSFFRSQQDSLDGLTELVNTCNEASSDCLDDMASAVRMIPLDARGLEAELLPMLRAFRKRHSETVLEYVDRIPAHLRPDLKDRMLSARSIQHSRTFKILARVQGEADALAVEP